MYEVILKLLNEEKRFTINELKELKKILEEYKEYEEMRLDKIGKRQSNKRFTRKNCKLRKRS